jgi:hypothetical protein
MGGTHRADLRLCVAVAYMPLALPSEWLHQPNNQHGHEGALHEGV